MDARQPPVALNRTETDFSKRPRIANWRTRWRRTPHEIYDNGWRGSLVESSRRRRFEKGRRLANGREQLHQRTRSVWICQFLISSRHGSIRDRCRSAEGCREGHWIEHGQTQCDYRRFAAGEKPRAGGGGGCLVSGHCVGVELPYQALGSETPSSGSQMVAMFNHCAQHVPVLPQLLLGIGHPHWSSPSQVLSLSFSLFHRLHPSCSSQAFFSLSITVTFLDPKPLCLQHHHPDHWWFVPKWFCAQTINLCNRVEEKNRHTFWRISVGSEQ